MIVAKFGGTSVSTKKSIQTICKIAEKEMHRQPVIIVSAVSKVTDALITAANKKGKERKASLALIKKLHSDLIDDLFDSKDVKNIMTYVDTCLQEIDEILQAKALNQQQKDTLISYGEIISSHIIASMLRINGIRTQQVTATKLVVTNDHFGSAEFLPIPTKRRVKEILLPLTNQKIVPVVTGFIGATEDGRITTLGRGGSDYSASIIGHCLQAEEIQIWTDVDGIYTADPRVVKNAKLLKTVSYKEASELAIFGAKVLHPRTIRPAITAGIPVKVLNTFHPENAGTIIQEKTQAKATVKAVTCKKRVPLVNIYSADMLLSRGFLMKIFEIFSRYNISIDLVSVSEVSVSVTLDNDDNLPSVLKELSKFADVTKSDTNGIVSLVGENIIDVPHIMKDICSILYKENITFKMISYGATNINISFVIPSDNIENAVHILHDSLLLQEGVSRKLH